MLLQTTTYEDGTLFVLPLVLDVSASEMYLLQGVAVVAKDLVAELVVGVFRTRAKVSIHDATWIRESVLCTCHRHNIGRFAIGIGIVVGTEIAIASDMLEASINAYKVLIVSRVHIPFGCSRIDVMLELLGEWRLVWLEAINAITATAKLGSVVVFRCNLGVVGCLEIRAEANRCGVEVWDVGIAIIISVVLLAVALYTKEEESRFLVFRHDTGVHIGANAIAGVVNIITKEPSRNSLNISNSSAFTQQGTYDINTNMNASVVSENQKAGLFLFGVQRNRQQYDRDNDGYSDIPHLNSTTVGFRSYFKTSDYSKITAEYHHTTEFRRGGYGIDSLQPHESPLTEQLKHNIDAATAKWDMYTADNKHFVSVYTSFQHIARDSYFGTNYNPNAYGKSTDIVSVTGAQYRFSYPCGIMNADLSAGAEYSYNQLRDQILGYDRNTLQKVHLGGGYVQNEWKNKQWSILVGGRLEQHSLLDKPVFSPRANIRYTPIDPIILRVSYASGYRAPQIYEEDLHVGAVGGEVSLISLDENLKPEYSHSISGSIDMYKRFGKWDLNLTLEGFFTQLNDVFTLVENGHDAQGNLLLTRTNASGARVAGMNIEAKVGFGHLLTFQAGYTYNHSRYIEPLQWSENPNIAPQRRMFRTPDHYGYFLCNIEPVEHFHIVTNGKVTGNMLVQHFAGYVPEDEEVTTPTFFEWDIKLCYDIPLYKHYTLEVNAGVKNILDQFQSDLDKGMDRDAGFIYGPATPRTFFAGINLKI